MFGKTPCLVAALILSILLPVCAQTVGGMPAYRADEFINRIGLNGNPCERVLADGPFAGAGPHYAAEQYFGIGIRHYRACPKNDLVLPDQPAKMKTAYDRWGAQAMMLIDPHKTQDPAELIALLKQY